MSELGAENRDEKISQIVLPEIDCDCMDKSTRKVLTHVLDKELKYLSRFPTAMVDDATYSLEILREKIAQCDFPKPDKTDKTEKKQKTKRKPSEYNLHMKECASSKEKGGQGKGFKECALDWRKLKNKKKD